MVQLYLVLLIDSFLLQPFRRILGFVMRFMWAMPPIVAPSPLQCSEEETLKGLHELVVERLGTLGRTIHGQGKKAFQLWPSARVMRASRIWPPECRGGDYVWERNPVKGCVYSEAQRRARGLDLIFPVLIMEELQARGLDASVRSGK